MQTKNAIGNLINRYNAVLKKCNLINVFGSLALAGVTLASITVAKADVSITNFQELKNFINGTDSGQNTGTVQNDITADSNTSVGTTTQNLTLNLSNYNLIGFAIEGDPTYYSEGISVGSSKTLTINGGDTSATIQNFSSALYVNSNATVEISNLNFKNNIRIIENSSAAYGGAIANAGSIRFNTAVEFSDNSVQSNGRIHGGAVVTTGSGQSITFEDYVLFQNNYAVTSGSYAEGGAFSTYDGTVTDFKKNVDFKYNGAITTGSQNPNGGALFNYSGTTTFYGTANFYRNYAKATSSGWAQGGAIYTWAPIIFNDDVTFTENYAVSATSNAEGGAIFNNGTITINDVSIFNGNYTQSTYKATGGAVFNNLNCKITFSGCAVFTENYAVGTGSGYAQGGALYNRDAGTTIFNVDSIFTGDYAKAENGNAQGGAVFNNGMLTFGGESYFTNNHATVTESGYAQGGALYNTASNTTISFNNTAEFNGNYALSANNYAQGGAIFNNGTITLNDVTTFTDNYTQSTANAMGGAIYNNGDSGITFNGETVFIDNYATSTGSGYGQGGALYNNESNGAISFNNTAEFNGNYALSANYYAQGGALFTYGSVTFHDDVTFTENYAVSAKSNAEGGAIYNNGTITLNDATTLTGNYTQSTAKAKGGAIFNNSNRTITFNGATDFTNNHATATENGYAQGGAIYNRESGTTVFNAASSFTANYVKTTNNYSQGGAIVNNGTLTFADATTTFTNNYTESSVTSSGGAIYNNGNNTITFNGQTDFNYNHATATGSGYAQGGAIYNYAANGAITFNNSAKFNGNYAKAASGYAQGGAVFNNGIITFGGNTTFSNNYVEGSQTVTYSASDSIGGALYNAGTATFSSTTSFSGNGSNGSSITTVFGGAVANNGTLIFDNNVVFSTNTANYGGALVNVLEGTLTINGMSDFGDSTDSTTGNTAGSGGAIVNGLNSFITFAEQAIFYYNTADSSYSTDSSLAGLGGALYNKGEVSFNEGSTFSNNTATVKGGAIYNEGTIDFSGTNEFSNNTAGGEGNDIYNAGIINIQDGAILTLNSGYKDTGSVATLNIGIGSTLNLNGSSTINNILNLSSTNTPSTLTFGGTSTIHDIANLSGTGAITIGSGATVTLSLENLSSDSSLTNNGVLNTWGKPGINIAGTGTTYIGKANSSGESLDITTDRGISGALNLNGNTLNMQDANNAFSTVTIGTLAGSGNLTLDVDLTKDAVQSDYLKITSSTADTLNLSAIRIVKGCSAGTAGYIQYANIQNPASTITLYGSSTEPYRSYDSTTKTTYVFAIDTTNQNQLNFATKSGEVLLKEYIQGSTDTALSLHSYNFNESNAVAIPLLGTTANTGGTRVTGNTLNININNGSILDGKMNTESYGTGITVAKDFTLNLQGSSDAVITGYDSALTVNKGATVNISTLTFKDNQSADITNSGTVNIVEGAVVLKSGYIDTDNALLAINKKSMLQISADSTILGQVQNEGVLNLTGGHSYTINSLSGTGLVNASAETNLSGKVLNMPNSSIIIGENSTINYTKSFTVNKIALVKSSLSSDKITIGEGGISLNESTVKADDTFSVSGQLTAKNSVIESGTLSVGNIILQKTQVTADTMNLNSDVSLVGGSVVTVNKVTLSQGTLDDPTILRVGKAESNGGDKLIANRLNFSKNSFLIVDPSWDTDSAIAVIDKVSSDSSKLDLTTGFIGVGQNAIAVLGNSYENWMNAVLSSPDVGALKQSGITAAFGICKPLDLTNGDAAIIVDGSQQDTNLVQSLQSSQSGSITFADDSLLAVNAKVIGNTPSAAAILANAVTASGNAKLYLKNVPSVGNYYIINAKNTTLDSNAWQDDNLLIDNKVLAGTFYNNSNSAWVTVRSKNFGSLLPRLDPALATYLYGMPAVDADVDSENYGARFVYRAINELDSDSASATIEGAAKLVFTAAVPQINFSLAKTMANSVLSRDFLSSTPGTGVSSGDTNNGFVIWAMPLYQHDHVHSLKSTNFRSGYKADIGGLALGTDYTMTDTLRVGLAINGGGGKANSSGEFNETENSLNFAGVNAYASWKLSNFSLFGHVGFLYTNNDISQKIPSELEMGSNKADIDSRDIYMGIRASWKFSTDWMDFIPHIGMQYHHLQTSGFDIKNDGHFLINSSKIYADILQIPIGVTMRKDILDKNGWNVKASLDLSVTPVFGNRMPTVNVRFDPLTTDTNIGHYITDSCSGRAAVGLEAQKGKFSVGLNYSFDVDKHSRNHGVSCIIGYKF